MMICKFPKNNIPKVRRTMIIKYFLMSLTSISICLNGVLIFCRQFHMIKKLLIIIKETEYLFNIRKETLDTNVLKNIL